MGTLTRNSKDFILAMLEGNVERELQEIESRIRSIREYVKDVTHVLHESMKEKGPEEK